MNMKFLCNTGLSRGSVAAEVPEMLKCLGGSTRKYAKGETVLTPCATACARHSLLIRNLPAITAEKNPDLSRRSLHTAAKTIRGRVFSCLSLEAPRRVELYDTL